MHNGRHKINWYSKSWEDIEDILLKILRMLDWRERVIINQRACFRLYKKRIPRWPQWNRRIKIQNFSKFMKILLKHIKKLF